MSNKYSVTAVDRAFDVLECLARNEEEMGLADIARETDIPKSTLFRIMTTLQERSCVSRDEERKTYRLGMHLLELGHAFRDQSNLLDAAETHMGSLAEACEESVFLGMLDEDEIIYVRRKESPKSAVFVRKLGKRAPAYCTATGLAMLAFRPEEDVKRILQASDLKAYSAHTTTDRDELHQKLEDVRQSCVAVVDGEYNPSLLCVSAPVFDENGTSVASITVALLSAQVSGERVESMKTQVRNTAQALSKERGYFEDHFRETTLTS